jgi:hypothetical protein
LGSKPEAGQAEPSVAKAVESCHPGSLQPMAQASDFESRKLRPGLTALSGQNRPPVALKYEISFEICTQETAKSFKFCQHMTISK